MGETEFVWSLRDGKVTARGGGTVGRGSGRSKGLRVGKRGARGAGVGARGREPRAGSTSRQEDSAFPFSHKQFLIPGMHNHTPLRRGKIFNLHCGFKVGFIFN